LFLAQGLGLIKVLLLDGVVQLGVQLAELSF
jgi:hypothetical protein